MSADNNEADEMIRCASCGTVENDDIKLKKCTACYVVRYCSIKCQKEHRPKHKRECKKRAAELHDEPLFKQPGSSHLGDCPICFVPLPLDIKKSTMEPCCSKLICEGCNYANQIRETEERLEKKCPFCRHPSPKSSTECEKVLMKRVEANDPVALREVGNVRDYKGDNNGAVEYWTKAAAMGDAIAHYQLSCSYRDGGVEKDQGKVVYHLEQAAIGGHPNARCNLGVTELENGRYERTIRHFIIAANLGDDISMEKLKKMYQFGLCSKEDLAAALRAHQAAVDAMKSPHREEAEAHVGFNMMYSAIRM